MRAIVIADRAAGTAGVKLVEQPTSGSGPRAWFEPEECSCPS
jgi:hypothetical protein